MLHTSVFPQGRPRLPRIPRKLAMKLRPALIVFLLAAAAGFTFAAVSTADFVQHLDRQTHSLSCSFVPGLGRDASGSSGCHAALMSPYSSAFRTWLWGGIPTTLAGMAVYAFLFWRAARMALDGKATDKAATTFLLAATGMPVAASIVYGSISAFILGELCKTCAGMYASSAVLAIAAIALVWGARKPSPPPPAEEGDDEAPPENLDAAPAPTPAYGMTFAWGAAEASAFVVAPVLAYLVLAPDFSDKLGQCGELIKPADPAHLFVPLGGPPNGVKAIELIDPLCPSCAAFEDRLAFSGLDARLSRSAVMFPLDNACNWMVGSAVHPGACAISEAVLCAEGDGTKVLAWAFEHGEAIKTASAADPAAAARMVGEAFPGVRGCVGSDKARQRVNRSLRWAVQNQLPIVTPQLFVDGVRLCDEDTDLGLDWALTKMLAGRKEAR